MTCVYVQANSECVASTMASCKKDFFKPQYRTRKLAILVTCTLFTCCKQLFHNVGLKAPINAWSPAESECCEQLEVLIITVTSPFLKDFGRIKAVRHQWLRSSGQLGWLLGFNLWCLLRLVVGQRQTYRSSWGGCGIRCLNPQLEHLLPYLGEYLLLLFCSDPTYL